MAGVRWDRTVWWRRVRRVAIVVAILLIVVGLVGFLVAPRIVKSVAEQQIAEQLGRKATIGVVRLNPYTLSATLDDFKLYEADGIAVAVEVRTLFADISSASLYERALVFDQLKITAPTIRVTRFDPQRFSFTDIVERLAAKPKSDSTFRYSINNIEIDSGVIDVDDRVTDHQHHIDGVRIALPFLSNLPYDTTIFVTPEFTARVDGSTIGARGKAQPFSSSHEAAIDIDATDLDLTEYMDLSPTKLPFRVASGRLSVKLALVFRGTSEDAAGQVVPQSMAITGQVGVAALDLTDAGGRSAIRAKRIDVDIAKLDPFGGDVSIRRIALVEPHVEVTRRVDGSIDLVDLFAMPIDGSPPVAPTAATRRPALAIAAVAVEKASLRFVDQTLRKPATTQIDDLDADLGNVVMQGTSPTTYKVAVRSGDATLKVEGEAVVEKRQVSGTIAVENFRPSTVSAYLAATVAASIEGNVGLDAHYRIDASGATPLGTIDRIAIRIDKLRTALPDDKAALMAADRIVLDGGAFDLEKRAFTAESLKLTAPVAVIKRDAKGRLNLRAALVDAKPAVVSNVGTTEGVAVKLKPDATQPFTAVIKSFAVERGDLTFDDLATGTPVRVRAQPFDFKAGNVGTAANASIPFDLDAGIDQRGRLKVTGKVAVSPLDIDATVEASQVPVGWLAAYAGDALNVRVESADLDAKGALRASQARDADAPVHVAYRGAVGIARMRATDKATAEEFLQWKTLEIPRVDFAMPAKNAPFAVTLGDVALNDFYVRVIVNSTGRLNLQDVVGTPGQRQSVTTPEAEPAPAVLAARAATSDTPKPLVHVGALKLTNGRIGITDNFIKPNYSANLNKLSGEISAIASDEPKPAELKLTGRIDGDGALDVSGKINPFAATLYTDIAAEAKDIELTRLSPYAIKYAGYAIDRGKLSMTVRYHIENGKLDASNRLFLDQLTFGRKVESPTATKLPVLLAIALLKNARGEIDVNLPVSGSLDDPQFSVGSVILRVIGNLLTRAVASPFSLIASAVGGAGGAADELGYVQFQPGASDLAPQGKTKLETLAKALSDRPALKLDIIGRYDPATDPEGIKRDHLLDRLKDLKAKDLSKAGERVGRDDVTIEAGEYATYLARVYDDTKLADKPRNLVGLAKTLPPEEMEKLLLGAMKLDENDPRWLAEARADVVRHYIEDTGKVAPSRVFLVTPKLNADGIGDKGVPNRVDFALR